MQIIIYLQLIKHTVDQSVTQVIIIMYKMMYQYVWNKIVIKHKNIMDMINIHLNI